MTPPGPARPGAGVPDGAWGLRWPDVPGAARILVHAPDTWPAVASTVDILDGPAPDEVLWSADAARYPLLAGGYTSIDRRPLAVHLRLPAAVADEAVVQPHLASTAGTVSLWLGRVPLHAGAFVVDGGAWGVLGDKEAGKSSTLAWLHRAAVPVLTDDLLVVDDGQVACGPRCVDLRPSAARQLGMGVDLGTIGNRGRWRVYLPAAAASTPLRGFVVLDWGDETSVERVPVGERLERLVAQRSINLPVVAADDLIEMASRPCLRWTRPRGWDHMASSVDRLLDHLARP